MSTPTPTLTYALCSITGLMEGEIPQVQATQAANVWAETSGLALVGALNARAGTYGLDLQGVLNRLAGVEGFAVQECARLLLQRHELESGGFDYEWNSEFNTSGTKIFDSRVFDWLVFDTDTLADVAGMFDGIDFNWVDFAATYEGDTPGGFRNDDFDGDFA